MVGVETVYLIKQVQQVGEELVASLDGTDGMEWLSAIGKHVL